MKIDYTETATHPYSKAEDLFLADLSDPDIYLAFTVRSMAEALHKAAHTDGTGSEASPSLDLNDIHAVRDFLIEDCGFHHRVVYENAERAIEKAIKIENGSRSLFCATP